MFKPNSFLDKDMFILMLYKISRPAIEVFTSSFLISHLLRAAHNDTKPIALYYILYAVFITIVFFAFSNFVKRKNKMLIFRAGVILHAIQLFVIMKLGPAVIDYIVYLGISFGTYVGLYALAMNNILSEKLTTHKISKYMGYGSALSSITKIASSYLLGKFLTISSFEACISIILALSCFEIILSFFIHSEKKNKEKFHPILFWQGIKESPVFRKTFFVEFLRGLSISGSLAVVLTLYTVYKFETDLNLGIFNAAFAILSILISYVFGRYIDKSHYAKLSLLNTFSILLTTALFCFYDNRLTFILYNICYASFIQVLLLIVDVNLFRISNCYHVHTSYKIEYFSIREVFLNAGRVLGFSLLFLTGVYNPEYTLKLLLIAMTVSLSLIGYVSIALQAEIEKEEAKALSEPAVA